MMFEEAAMELPIGWQNVVEKLYDDMHKSGIQESILIEVSVHNGYAVFSPGPMTWREFHIVSKMFYDAGESTRFICCVCGSTANIRIHSMPFCNTHKENVSNV